MKYPRGYTLVELLSVISIAAILTAVGVPSYRYVTTSNRTTAEVNQLYDDMELTRSAAMREGLPFTICPSTDAQTCAGQSQSWQKGWIVFRDSNGNQVVDAEDEVLRIQRPFASLTDIFSADQGASAVTFNREGFALNLPNTSSGFITIALHTTPYNNQWSRCIQVTLIGLISTERAAQGACT